jgi:hypothetical protein
MTATPRNACRLATRRDGSPLRLLLTEKLRLSDRPGKRLIEVPSNRCPGEGDLVRFEDLSKRN